MESECFQGTQDTVGRTRLFARRVDVFHPDQPQALVSLCLEVASYGGDQGAKMQWSGGGGREAATILSSGIDHAALDRLDRWSTH